MSTWTTADFQRGDTAHIALGCGVTRRYVVLEARSQVLELRDPKTGISEQRTYDQVAGRTRSGVTDVEPPGSGPWPKYGDYIDELDRSQLAGTAWTCGCGGLNPGIWDTCHKCQWPGNA